MARKKKGSMDNELEMPLLPVQCDWRPPNLSDLPSWKNAKRVGFDLETKDPQLRELGPGVRRGGYIIGYSFAIEDGPGAYIPFRHFGGDNLDPDQAMNYLRDNAREFKGTLVGANLPYDLDYAAEAGATFDNVSWFRDVQIADPLIYELHMSYSLDAILERWGLPGKDEALLREAAQAYRVDAKSEMWQLPGRFAGVYGEADARKPLALLRRQERKIDDLKLQGVFDLESRLLPVLLKMRRRGVRIDQDRLDRIDKWALEQEGEACAKIRHLSGRAFGIGDVGKAAVLSPIFAEAGIELPQTETTEKESITKEILAGAQHPLADAVLHGRRMNKLRTTFVSSVRRYMVNGRLHGTLNQLRGQRDFEADGSKGAKFGRLSSSDPNLQQQPSRGDFAKEWRSIYLPEEGKLWASVDYSQQEPRMGVHFAVAAGWAGMIPDRAYKAACDMAERYRIDPTTDFHNAVVEATGNKVSRKDAKPLGLGRMYGMGAGTMCKNLGLPTSMAIYDTDKNCVVYSDEKPEEYRVVAVRAKSHPFESAGPEGREVLRKFDAAAPYLGALAKACQKRASDNGYIRTLSGRICHFPENTGGGRKDKFMWLHKALNRVVQGSSGDQMKKAMVDMDAAGIFLQLQIHDEVAISVENREEAERAAEIMGAAYDLYLPFACDIEIGPSWGEAK